MEVWIDLLFYFNPLVYKINSIRVKSLQKMTFVILIGVSACIFVGETMRKALIAILFVCYWAVMLGPFLTYISFYANRSYIAANLCENKDNPVMECHGSCFLTKELAKTVELSTESQKSAPESIIVVHAFSPHTAFSPVPFFTPVLDTVYLVEQHILPVSVCYTHTILDPPRV